MCSVVVYDCSPTSYVEFASQICANVRESDGAKMDPTPHTRVELSRKRSQTHMVEPPHGNHPTETTPRKQKGRRTPGAPTVDHDMSLAIMVWRDAEAMSVIIAMLETTANVKPMIGVQDALTGLVMYSPLPRPPSSPGPPGPSSHWASLTTVSCPTDACG